MLPAIRAQQSRMELQNSSVSLLLVVMSTLGLLDTFYPYLQLKGGSPLRSDEVAQGLGLSWKGWRSHSLSGALFHWLTVSVGKKPLSFVMLIHSLFLFMAIVPHSLAAHPCKDPVFVFLISSSWVLAVFCHITPNPLSSRLNKPHTVIVGTNPPALSSLGLSKS